MALPNFTAGRSLYRTSGHYRMAGVHKQADRSVRSAQLPSCISGGLCYTPKLASFAVALPVKSASRYHVRDAVTAYVSCGGVGQDVSDRKSAPQIGLVSDRCCI